MHLNLGSGHEISIKQLTQLIARVVDYDGEVIWNEAHPDGTPRKVLDNSRVNGLGWKASIPLEIGIQSTYEWLINRFEYARID